MRRKVEEYNHDRCDERSLNQSLQSYLGILQHCSGFKVRQKLLHQVWLEKEEHFPYREEMK